MTNWKEIHPDFTPELQKEWEERNFNFKQCEEWIDAGLEINDYEFCTWLRDVKKINVRLLNMESYQVLREQFTKYLENRQYDSDQELTRRTKRSLSITAENNDKNKAVRLNFRNILIVGITGSGKSALANVLTGTNQFEEKDCGISVTKNFQKSDPFEWENINYYVIDNIGFGDTDKLAEEVILYEIGKGIYLAKEGIDQVFFVFKDKFSPEQIRSFNLFKKLISESGITKFTTLIRTHFVNFRNQQECEKDRKDLLDESSEIREIIESCNDILHVDNPPIPVIDSEDSEDEIEDKKGKISRNDGKRKVTRKITLNHLTENCHDVYKLREWDSIYAIVADYFKKEKEIEKNNSLTKKEELERARNKAISEIKFKLEKELPAIIREISAAIEQKNVQKI